MEISSSAAEQSRVIIFAGPNGSGKSTVNAAFLADPASNFTGQYVNADDIARSLSDQYPDATARNIAAAQIAEQRRAAALAGGEPFAFETVMSTPEKVALITQAQAHGYYVQLIFVTTRDPSINVDRVATRVAAGGHDVQPDAIRARYHKVMELLPSAIEHADSALVFDNSGASPVLIASKEHGDFSLRQGLPPELSALALSVSLGVIAREKSLSHINEVVKTIANVKPVGAVDIETVAADASNGKTYTGKILALTKYHALQQDTFTGKLVIHDLSLKSSEPLHKGVDTKVSYAYDKGKIVEPRDRDLGR